jgi:hypothetical protein
MKNDKSGLRAFNDPYTKRIFNCKKDSLIYWHEKGHQDWFKRGIETETQTYAILLFFGAITIIGIELSKGSLFFIIATWILFLFNEYHAWWYAFKNFKWKKHGE